MVMIREVCEKRFEEKKVTNWFLPAISIVGLIVSGYFIWHHRKYLCLFKHIHITSYSFLHSDDHSHPV